MDHRTEMLTSNCSSMQYLHVCVQVKTKMQTESALSVMGPRPMELSVVLPRGPQGLGPNGKPRTSSLESPIMLLSGHQSAVYTMKFNPAGTIIASGSHDKEIFLWNVRGDCKNFMVLKGHKNAVLDVQWTTDGSTIISASPDKTVRAWDVETGKQIKKMAEHSSFVNSCCPARRGPPLIVSGSDDGTAKLWDMRQRGAIQTFPDKFQITAVSFSDASDKICTGGIDNDVKLWDLRRCEVTMTLQGHQDTITGMQLSPDGSYLLTNAMDCTLRIWDMRPYAPQNRCVKILEGHQHNFEKNLLKCSWSPDGSKVTGGSSDRMVYVWDTTSRRILYKLPGHTGCVNECVFHPNEPIVGSCSSDKQMYLGEI
ncbi:U5 small nuclear ribonucleoprotein 40 kDa protein isoform X1 [Solanum pennellii]|uniref:U5 small nuclear ribonucleoprotein 40 kDa protein isoform X1 n=2 Tax=Solanum pennellii TaxID=28526 RepID=A0ABM1GH91_SOLPN|nr:U5 small nuclear ribonucleoprotein 40 kDa protein isoform X1 [Solanum pennellii]